MKAARTPIVKLPTKAPSGGGLPPGCSQTDACLTMDREWHITSLNQEAERLLGRTHAELTGKEFWAEFPDTIGSTFERRYRRAMADTEAVDYEEFYLPLNSWFGVRAHPSEQGLAIYLSDINEVKRLLEDLKLKNTILQTQQDISLDAILVVDEGGRILSYNQQFVELWRLPPQLVSALAAEPVLQAMIEQVENPKTVGDRIQYLYQHHDKKSHIEMRLNDGRVVDQYSAPLNEEDGTYYGRAWYFRDITERKAEENRIIYLNRVYAMLSDINTLIVRVRDQDELFQESCRVAVDIGGFRMAMIGIVNHDRMKITPVASEGKDGTLLNAIEKLLSSDELASITMVARAIREKRAIISNDSKNDPQVVLGKQYAKAGINSIIILPLIIADEAVGALALYANESNFFHDEEVKLLTELVGDISFAMDYLKAQEALRDLTEELEDKVAARTADLERARHEADQANQAKSVFLATMSHEIRTPMNGVIGMIEVLRNTRLKGHQVEMVNLISESAFSLLDIIEDILDLSKIEAGKLEVEHAPMPVADVVEKACDLLEHLAARKGVGLTLFIDPAIPAEVLGDALRLRQVLVNFANNAIKFSSGQQRPGQVSVRAVLVEHGPQQVTVEFQVIDNGIGMDEETQSRLFTAFTQADTTTTRCFGGTGLGLVISNRLVELMGGVIAVQSTPGKGTTFSVRLPFTPLAASPIGGDTPVDLTGLSCMVLGDQGLADDLAVYLTYGGALVEQAPDLVTAIKLIGTVAPGLWLFIIDTRDATPPLEELRAACQARANLDPRFVVVEHGHHQPGGEHHPIVTGRGQRRQGRIQSVGLVILDGDVMHRQHFLKAVAIAAGRAQQDEAKEMPLHDKAGAITPPSSGEALRQGHLILVAEDNKIGQEVIQHQLGLLGYGAEVTSDGREALERWENGDHHALLLTDLHMPEMDGYQLTAAIRAGEDGKRRIPIIALTANALKSEADNCRASGMDDYLSKPTRLADLKAMLDKWLPTAVVARTD